VFSLAHLSDLHLGPLPRGAAIRDYALKRQIGYLSWRLSRHRLHVPQVAEAVAADIAEVNPDHVAVTGDIVNISAHDEFPAAAAWLERLGEGANVSFVPGNHDTYVRFGWERGLGYLARHMAGDMRLKDTYTTPQVATPFPFVRLRRNVALIGLCSGLPQPLHKAAGKLGETQLTVLAPLLRDLRERGYARVIMIHHPPLPGLAPPRKALIDAFALKDILVAEGAELVLHGHNHLHMQNRLESRFGAVHVFGVPSASMGVTGHYDPAAWNLYEIVRQGGRWVALVTIRAWDPATRQMGLLKQFALSS
jgi:3',5'-cyclic AMP phosphodiesterase CpdA